MPSISRRQFLATSAVSVAGLPLLAADRKFGPNDRLSVGIIGCAARGQENWTQMDAAGGAEIVAYCDVDENRIGTIAKAHPDAKYFVDFRKLLEFKGLDAVVISTPDHTHAVAALRALQAGYHVYCEKPLTHTVAEARLLAETAAKLKRVTQMGTQIHAGNNYRRVAEIIQSGAIGKVSEAHVWCAKSWGGSGKRPEATPPIPKGLNYDLWLGPRAERPYSPEYIPFNWRRWWAFGGGTLADMGCHYIDLVFWALKLRHPTKVSAEGPAPTAETAADWLIAHWDFPTRGEMPPVSLTWYDGGKRPKYFADGKLPQWGDGVLFVGEKGMLISDYSHYKLLPEKEFEGFKAPPETIPNSIGHYREFIEACKTGGSTTCNFNYSGALTESVLLGTVAYRLGKPIEWDAVNLKATNVPEAEKFLRHESYRKGFELT